MKSEKSTQEVCWKTTFMKTQSKLNEIWKFPRRIQLKDNFTEDSIKISEIWKFDPKILLKDNFTEDAIELKLNRKIRPENSVERQLSRWRNRN